MSWAYLILAGLFEIAWPIGLKLAQTPERRWLGMTLAIGGLAISGLLLYWAQQTIPLGTSYAAWTGIGAAGTFLVGICFFGDPATVARYVGVALIIGGVVTLKLAH